MALKMPKLFGESKAKLAAAEAELDMPTTQVRMGASTPEGYDPLATVSVMEQLRAATAKAITPWRLPVIGDMPVAKQLQVLGTTFVHPRGPRRADDRARQPRRVAGRAGHRHRDRDADALAAARARLRARRAGPGPRVRRGARQPHPLRGQPRRAAERRRGARQVAGRACRTPPRSSSSNASATAGRRWTRRPVGWSTTSRA